MSRIAQGTFGSLPLRPWMLKLGFALYPPLLGAHIRLEHLSRDFRYARVAMRQRITNSNLWGVHFGGSLFAMTDSIYALMVKRNLGPEYVVWDKSATIDFLKPGRGRVYCEFHLDETLIERIRRETRHGGKSEPTIDVHVLDPQGETVAAVSKTLYIRKLAQQSTRPGAPS
jgi:acyl-coenzyme A thioesterase PaaI-like protein